MRLVLTETLSLIFFLFSFFLGTAGVDGGATPVPAAPHPDSEGAGGGHAPPCLEQ